MNKRKMVTVLGSTGSIGTQALDVVRKMGYGVVALAAGNNAALLEEQCREFSPRVAYINDKKGYEILKENLKDTNISVKTGENALLECASMKEADIVLNALLGIRGLKPTIAAINAGITLALANKESLVTAGEYVMNLAKEKGVSIIPVDSEHSAIFQCLGGNDTKNVKRLIITASGGAFFGKTTEELENVKAADALKHPTWSMGKKITIDSATLMNKGFEFIEAAHLFGVDADNIKVIVHRESIIHSMVEYNDGAVIAQLGSPDMRLPIQYAMTYPERTISVADPLDLLKAKTLHFAEPDMENFPLLPLAIECFKKGGNLGAALNGADEAAVALFLDEKIGYNDIYRLVKGAVDNCDYIKSPTIDEIIATDIQARAFVKENAPQQ